MRQQLLRKSCEVGEQRTLRLPAEHHMQLLHGDGDADAREHAVHHGGGERKGKASYSRDAEQDLQNPCSTSDSGRGGPAVLLDEPGHDNSQTGGGAADLERGTAERSGHDTTDDGGDEPGDQWSPGSGCDPQRQRDSDQEDHQRGR
jgi:hypothetical protein